MSDNKSPIGEITEQLKKWGEQSGFNADITFIDLVYAELHRQAHRYLRHERTGHTLQTTALVHEAYLRLSRQKSFEWENRAQFYGVAATVMRRILIDYAKTRNRLRRGGPQEHIPLEAVPTIAVSDAKFDVLELDEALKRLATKDFELERIVELRFFCGLDVQETSEVLGISKSTVKRGWATAKAWLHRELNR